MNLLIYSSICACLSLSLGIGRHVLAFTNFSSPFFPSFDSVFHSTQQRIFSLLTRGPRE